MFSKEMIDLTVQTKKCFEAEIPDITTLMGIVADLWTLIDLEPKHSLHLRAQPDSVQTNKMLITIGRSDFEDDEIESLTEKIYDVTAEQYIFRVVPNFTILDDHPNANKEPRKQFSYDLSEELQRAEILTSHFIIDVAQMMSHADKLKLLANPDFQESATPLAAALRSALSARQPIPVHNYEDDHPKSTIF